MSIYPALVPGETEEYSGKIREPESFRKIKKTTFLSVFKTWMWIILLFSSVLQYVFFWSAENLFAIISVLIGWRLTEVYLLRPSILYKYSMSALVILGYSLTQYCLPLIFTILEGKPVVYNMTHPYQVFFHSICALCVLLVAHMLYTDGPDSSGGAKKKIQQILKANKFFVPPTDLQIWIIGIIGLLAILAKYLLGGEYADESSAAAQVGAGNKFIEGFMPYAYAPFIIMLKPLYYNRPSKFSKSLIYKMLLFTVALIGAGMIANSRATFMKGITSLGITYFLGLLLNKFDYRVFKAKYILMASFGLWVITGPLADLGTAMVVVRGLRSTVSGTELVFQTLETYGNKTVLEKYKKSSVEHEFQSDWNEHYFDNIFLARFCNLKYNDASLEQSNKIGRVDPMVQQNSIDRFWAILPQPVLTLLQININKKEVSASSFGDYLFMRAGGSSALGGFRTGQFAGTGMAAFGWWYLLLLGIGMIPLYFFLDVFVLWDRDAVTKSYRNIISLAGLIPVTTYFMFLSLLSTSESVVCIYTFLLRGWLQSIFLYWLIFFISRKISFVIKSFI